LSDIEIAETAETGTEVDRDDSWKEDEVEEVYM
jgi:hypothetical protein